MKPTHIRVKWLTSEGTSEPVTGRIEALHPGLAFARIATGFAVQTHGHYELLLDGKVVESGSCTISSKRQGAGVLLELSAARPSVKRVSGRSSPLNTAQSNGQRPAEKTKRRRTDETGTHRLGRDYKSEPIGEPSHHKAPMQVKGAPPSSPPRELYSPEMEKRHTPPPAPSSAPRNLSPVPFRIDADISALYDKLRAHEEELTHHKDSALGVHIGIDLGTSNLCVAASFKGKLEVVPSRLGTTETPSIVTVEGGSYLLGHAAKKRLVSHPHDTIYGSKRLVGRGFRDFLAEHYQDVFAYRLAETADQQFGATISGRVVSFDEVVEKLLLEAVSLVFTHYNVPIASVVITMPAYFGNSQRQALRASADRVGLENALIVNEPTAAAFYYASQGATSAELLAVIDLGGGTFDVTILRSVAGHFEVVATGGDAFLGGLDVDDLLAGELLRRFQAEHDLRLDAQQVALVRTAAETAKRELTLSKETHVELPHFAHADGEAVALNMLVTRDELEELITDFVSDLRRITEETLALAALNPDEIGEVLLVGGASRMPIVGREMETLFGIRPRQRQPESAVALGAALLARGEEVSLRDVLPRDLGILEGEQFQRLIPQRTLVPTEREFFLKFKGPTRELMFYEGDGVSESGLEYLGALTIEHPRPRNVGTNDKVLLRVQVSAARELEFHAELDGVICETSWTTEARPIKRPTDAKEVGLREKREGGLGGFFAKLMRRGDDKTKV